MNNIWIFFLICSVYCVSVYLSTVSTMYLVFAGWRLVQYSAGETFFPTLLDQNWLSLNLKEHLTAILHSTMKWQSACRTKSVLDKLLSVHHCNTHTCYGHGEHMQAQCWERKVWAALVLDWFRILQWTYASAVCDNAVVFCLTCTGMYR